MQAQTHRLARKFFLEALRLMGTYVPCALLQDALYAGCHQRAYELLAGQLVVAAQRDEAEEPRLTALRVLGLGALASQEDVTRVYRQLSLVHHPDKVGGTTAAFQALRATIDAVMQSPALEYPVTVTAGVSQLIAGMAPSLVTQVALAILSPLFPAEQMRTFARVARRKEAEEEAQGAAQEWRWQQGSTSRRGCCHA